MTLNNRFVGTQSGSERLFQTTDNPSRTFLSPHHLYFMVQTTFSRVVRPWLFVLIVSLAAVPAAGQEVLLSIDTPVPGTEA